MNLQFTRYKSVRHWHAFHFFNTNYLKKYTIIEFLYTILAAMSCNINQVVKFVPLVRIQPAEPKHIRQKIPVIVTN